MEKSYFQEIYNPENFDDLGRQLLSELSNHLENTISGSNKKALDWKTPEQELQFWKDFLVKGEKNDFFSKVLERTTHTHHPKYIGHQVSAPAPITALTGMVLSLLNNGGAVYEMGMAPNAMERVVTDWLCRNMGWNDASRGILTSGGTLANLTALLTARRVKVEEDVWNQGHSKPLGIMVCEEAHYCIERAAKIMGLGQQGIISIPALDHFAMNVSILEEKYDEANQKGIAIFAIVGSAPSTATGAYDNLEAIGNFAQKYSLWFHVDGAHGGAAIFSEKYKPLLKGVENADSVIIDGHKMMLIPTITTALLYRNGEHSHLTFSQKADYLLTDVDDEDWYNLGKRTFECTKTMMSLHWFVLLKFYGDELFDRFVTRQYDLARNFAEIITDHPKFELAVSPMSNIICFRFVEKSMDDKGLNVLNASIRQQVLEDGEYYLVQTQLRGKHYLRTSLMNPFTTLDHLEALLHKIQKIAANLQ